MEPSQLQIVSILLVLMQAGIACFQGMAGLSGWLHTHYWDKVVKLANEIRREELPKILEDWLEAIRGEGRDFGGAVDEVLMQSYVLLGPHEEKMYRTLGRIYRPRARYYAAGRAFVVGFACALGALSTLGLWALRFPDICVLCWVSAAAFVASVSCCIRGVCMVRWLDRKVEDVSFGRGGVSSGAAKGLPR